MVFPAFFNLSLNLAIRSSWSESQSAPSLVFADGIELLHLCCKEYNQSDFHVDHLVMSMWGAFPCVVGRGCLLWPVCSLGKTLFAFALLNSIPQGQICLLFQVFLDFLLLHPSPKKWKGNPSWVLVLEGLVGLHRTIQLQLLQHYWLGHRLGLPWYWMVCLGNEQRSFCHFWGSSVHGISQARIPEWVSISFSIKISGYHLSGPFEYSYIPEISSSHRFQDQERGNLVMSTLTYSRDRILSFFFL